MSGTHKGWSGRMRQNRCWYEHPLTTQPNGRRVCVICRQGYRKAWYKAHKEREKATSYRNRFLREQQRYVAAWENQDAS
jgi:hypothetical protein